MLQIPDVRRWYENLARGSPNTAEVRIRRLSHFCKMNNTTPLGLVELGKTDRKGLEDLLQDHISMMEKNGSSPGYIDCTVKAVRSWLNHNEIELKRRIKIANRDFTPTLQNERVPTKEELQYLLIHADDRAKVAMSLVAMSGLRLETLGTFDASDGLVVGDLPELHVEKKSVSFIKIPTLVTVRREVSKTSHKYFTFLPKQGCDYLKAYLEKRMKSGEELSSSARLTPYWINKTATETINKMNSFAKQAEQLRSTSNSVQLNISEEPSMTTRGIISDNPSWVTRGQLLDQWKVLPGWEKRLNDFLKGLIETTRKYFNGKILCGTGTWENDAVKFGELDVDILGGSHFWYKSYGNIDDTRA
jgi:integrase